MNPTAEALTLFANFGIDATLDSVSIRGIFDAASQDALNILGNNPVFTCLSTDAAGQKGKTLVVNTVSYTVREIRPDGTGFSILELESQ